VEGTGYAFDLPSGWDEVAAKHGADQVIAAGDGASVVVLTGGVPAGRSPQQVLDAQVRAMQHHPEQFGIPLGSKIAVVGKPSPTRLSDAPAAQSDARVSRGTQQARMRATLAFHKDPAAGNISYEVGYVAPPMLFHKDMQALETVLDTWAWH
jgi:hypothetical protein